MNTLYRDVPVIGSYTIDGLLNSIYGRAFLGLVFLWPFAVMPIIWNEIGPTVKLGTQGTAALLVGTAVLYKGYRAFNSRAGICFGLLFLWFPLMAYFSLQWGGEMVPDKMSLYPVEMRSVFLSVLMYMFGYVAGRRMPTTAVAVAFIVLGSYIGYRSEVFLSEVKYWEFFTENGYNINYQYVGDAFAISALVLLSRLKNRTLATLVFAISVGLLFIVPSRSAVLIGAAALLIALVRIIPVHGIVVRLSLLVFLLVSYFGTTYFTDLLEASRLGKLFGDQTDESVLGRARAQEAGLQAIYDNPLFGRFQFQLEAFADEGLYIHSALDLWAQAGLLPFLAFVLAMLLIGLRIFSMMFRHGDMAFKVLPLFFFALASWSLARYPWAYQLFFAVGFVLPNTISKTRRVPRRRGV